MTENFKLKIVDEILTVYPPILLCVGLVGNTLSVIVLAQPSPRRTSTGVMLIFLTVTDTLILINSVLVRWLDKMFETNFRASSKEACKFHVFISYYLFQLSPWILVFVTLERVFSVIYPHKVRDVFTRRRILLSFVILVLVLVGINSHLIYLYEHEYNDLYGAFDCMVRKNFENFMFTYWTWIDFIIAFAVPFCVLVCGNILVIHKLRSSQRFRQASIRTTFRSGRKEDSHFTITALVLNMTFFCFVSPFSIFAIGQRYWFPTETSTLERIANVELISSILLMLLHTNSAINFMLYIFSGSRFRKDLITLFSKRRRYVPETMMRTRKINSYSMSK